MNKSYRGLRAFIISTLCLLIYSSNAFSQTSCALEAPGLLTEIEQQDGTKLKIRVIGNPFIFYVESEDGYSLIKNKTGSYDYAKPGANGTLVPSGVRAQNGVLKARQSNQLKVSKHLRYSGATLAEKQAQKDKFLKPNKVLFRNASSPEAIPPSGLFQHLLILIDFPDQPARFLTQEFDDLMNLTGYSVNGQSGSFRDFYYDNSYGGFDVQTNVVGWYTAKHNKAYYRTGDSFSRARELAREAVDFAENDGIDFNLFDNDKDGVMDVVTIAHSGRGAEETGDASDDIWSHKWNMSTVVYDGIAISAYTMNPETQQSNDRISNVGVYAHEFGHALGLPDLYDTNTFDNDNSAGAGLWCSMANSWGKGGASPANFGPWCKEQLGWITPTVLSGNGSVSNMKSVSEGPNYYKIPTADPQEYFLLCNNQLTKWNSSHPGSGLLVWHIDNNRRGNSRASQLQVVPEQADGFNDMENNRNEGDAGDPFPGLTNNRIFSLTSRPNSNTNAGEVTNITLSNIVEDSGLISFNYSTTTDPVSCEVSPGNFEILSLSSTSAKITWDVGDGETYRVIVRDAENKIIRNSVFDMDGATATHTIIDLDPASNYRMVITNHCLSTDETTVKLRRSFRFTTEDAPILKRVIGETGTVTSNQSRDANQFNTVVLKNNYIDPVVVMGPISYNGKDRCNVRVRNVQSNSFEFQIDEWDYRNVSHTQETISYMVVESGRYILENNKILIAGNTNVNDAWQTINLPGTLLSSPVVMSQIASTFETQAATTRQRAVTDSSFQVRIQEEEANDGVHANEMVSWIVMEGGINANESLFEVNKTGNTVTHLLETINFAQSYNTNAVFLAKGQTYDGPDPMALRYKNFTGLNVEIFCEEEQSKDEEILHTTEEIGYFVFDAGDIIAIVDNTSILPPVNAVIAASKPEEVYKARLFPNPANLSVHVAIEDVNFEDEVKISLISLLGEVVYTKQYSVNKEESFEAKLPVDKIKQGMYVMNIFVNNKPHSNLRFVKN